MRRDLFLWIGVLVASAACAALAGDAPLKPVRPAAPWAIEKLARCDDAQPGAGDKTADVPSAKYLHIHVALRPGSGDVKLHQFRITNDKGKTVAEVCGFHKGRAVLVFEGDWASLREFYLEGADHREPLIPAPPPKPLAKSDQKPQPNPAEPEPPVVMSRGASHPPASAKLEGVKPTAPAEPEAERGEMHARQSKPTRVPAAEERLPENKKLYQEVLVTQRSRVNVQGLDFEGDLQYRVLSSLAVDKRNPDGSLAVTQKVEQAELTKADPLTQTIVGELLGKLVGSTFRFSVSPDSRVVDFQGDKGRIRATAGNNPLGDQSLLMASIIDPDGWREIAELTFFRPPMPSEGGRKWDRAITHSWGPLGSWTGKVAYARTGQEGPLERIGYTFKLNYQAPKAGAGGLPFQISRADFKHQEAGGTIAFDRAKGRVVQAEEHFPVKGSLTIGLLGQDTPVDLNETQDFRVRIFER